MRLRLRPVKNIIFITKIRLKSRQKNRTEKILKRNHILRDHTQTHTYLRACVLMSRIENPYLVCSIAANTATTNEIPAVIGSFDASFENLIKNPDLTTMTDQRASYRPDSDYNGSE